MRPFLYAAETTALESGELYTAAMSAVSPARREKVHRFRFPADRGQSLGAELLLRRALRDAGVCREVPPLRCGEHGKPYLPDDSLFFSLSHSHGRALCAIAETETGCDIEQISPVTMKIAERFSPEERDDILSHRDETEQMELFYRYWTLKESFLKVTGMGLYLPLDAFSVHRDENGRISVVQEFSPRSFRFQEFSDIPGFRCALCTEEPCAEAELRILRIEELL